MKFLDKSKCFICKAKTSEELERIMVQQEWLKNTLYAYHRTCWSTSLGGCWYHLSAVEVGDIKFQLILLDEFKRIVGEEYLLDEEHVTRHDFLESGHITHHYCRDLLHNLKGPATINLDSTFEYYIYGKLYSKREWDIIVKTY